MSNSPLVSYTKISPNNSGKRTHKIDTITPHCVVGQLSVETVGQIFQNPSAYASSNYCIGTDGRVGMFVEECDRSWCSSNRANDERSVTIECASDLRSPYAFNDVVYNRLIELCADICMRNGKKKLLWLGSKEKTLSYSPKSTEMVLTVHRWFDNKSCPGDWMMAHMGDLAEKVTALLSGKPASTKTPQKETEKNKTEKKDEGDYVDVKVKELYKGDEGNVVATLQGALIGHGYSCGSYGADGDFGPATEKAVRAYQKAHGLDVDGIVGTKTWGALLKD